MNLDYQVLAGAAVVDGRFTVDLAGDSPHTGYVVSDRPGAERTVRVHSTRELADELYRFVIDHGRELRTGHLLGAWQSAPGRFVIDLVRVLVDRDHALQVAELAGQTAIFDLDAGKEIYL